MGVEGEPEESGTIWQRADGRPLKALELKVYSRAGLVPAEALKWANAGFEPYTETRAKLREAGADLETAKRLRQLGLDHRHLRYAQEHGVPLETAAAAHSAGASTPPSLDQARGWASTRRPSSHLTRQRFFSRALSLRKLNVSPTRLLGWRRAGLDLDECRKELSEGTAEEAVETNLAWQRVFSQPDARRAWRATGLAPSAAKTAAASGYRPVDVLEERFSEGPAHQDAAKGSGSPATSARSAANTRRHSSTSGG